MFILYSMSTIYKIYKLRNNTVEKIYIFNNDTRRSIDTIFENYEFEIIKKYGIVYENVNNNIYPDDTIETIKKKFINIEKSSSIDELYLFSNVKESFNSENIYKNLTQNGKLQLTKNILTEYLLNITNFDIKTLPVQSIYTYDDILSLNLEKYSLINLATLASNHFKFSFPIEIIHTNYPFRNKIPTYNGELNHNYKVEGLIKGLKSYWNEY